MHLDFIRKIGIIALFSVITGSFAATPPDLPFQRTCDSMLIQNTHEQLTHVHVSKTKPVYVFAVTCRTIPFPIATVMQTLGDIDRYTFMSIITRIEHLGTESTPLHRPICFMEASGNALAKTWYLGVFDTAKTDTLADFSVRFIHHADSSLALQCRDKVKAWLKVEYRDFSLTWRLRKVDDRSTRVELVAYLSLNMWIPKWLFDLTARMLFPGVVKDLERYLTRQN